MMILFRPSLSRSCVIRISISLLSLPLSPSHLLLLLLCLRRLDQIPSQLRHSYQPTMTTTMTQKTFTPRPSLASMRSSQSIICNSESSSSRNMAASSAPPQLSARPTHAPMLPNEVLDLVRLFSSSSYTPYTSTTH